MNENYDKIKEFVVENKYEILLGLIIIGIIYFVFFYKTKESIVYLNNAKPNLYCFWTGTNPLTKNRKTNLKTLKNTGFNVILVTPNNLDNYILIDYPLHKGYQFLSEVHKADYLRCYFMNFYGGGYSDIKRIDESWLDQYNELNNSDYWGCGYAEKNPNHICYGIDKIVNIKMRNNYNKLIGNGSYIFKPNTPLTNEWYKSMIKLMDEKYENLKKFPSKTTRQVYSQNYPYPLEWNELLGRIFHPIVYKYEDKLMKDLPYVITEKYR
tara:strand:- start:5244 stop:6044 length:801 start_codon:yes stop_codon:yes gene_type:complete